MECSFEQVDSILKTLPIGYYAGRSISTSLNKEAPASFYNASNDEIGVSYPQLAEALNDYDGSLEEAIRTMLYHEVSHAILTSKELGEVADDDKGRWVMNVFEDERIETILSHFYLNVHFKQFCKKLNKYKGEKPKNKQHAFYHLVRFRVGPQEYLTEVDNLIRRYRKLNSNSDYYHLYDYYRDVMDLYERFMDDDRTDDYDDQQEDQQNKKGKKGKSGKGQGNGDDGDTPTPPSPSDDGDSDDSDGEGEGSGAGGQRDGEENEDGEGNSGGDGDPDDEDGENECGGGSSDNGAPCHGRGDIEPSLLSDKEVKDLFKKAIDVYVDKDLVSDINDALNCINIHSKKNGSAINSYSGVFDPRAAAREDYKYFVHRNRLGSAKAFSKVKLNLFIDCSGSFHSSQETVNKLLYALGVFERKNKDFTFDVVACQMGEMLLDKKNRMIKCEGGNKLDEHIFDLFKQVQQPEATNYNIVLFDGDAFSDYWGSEERGAHKNFGAFNHSNVTIISDYDNADVILKYSKASRNIITSNYTYELVKNVLDTLKLIAR